MYLYNRFNENSYTKTNSGRVGGAGKKGKKADELLLVDFFSVGWSYSVVNFDWLQFSWGWSFHRRSFSLAGQRVRTWHEPDQYTVKIELSFPPLLSLPARTYVVLPSHPRRAWGVDVGAVRPLPPTLSPSPFSSSPLPLHTPWRWTLAILYQMQSIFRLYTIPF